MDAHDGRISVDVGATGGTGFTLYFPLAEEAARFNADDNVSV